MAKPIETWRTKEQVLEDLAKALHLSTPALEQNRRGRLAADQWQVLFFRFLNPVVTAAGCILAPFCIWALMASANSSVSFGGSLSDVFSMAFKPGRVFENHGMVTSLAIIALTLGCIGVGLYQARNISLALYFDLIERSVVIKEGRVEAREEEIFRSGGRDPLEHYFLDLKTEKFSVPREAVLAIDSGAAYNVYVLPRSRTLVAIEPKRSLGDPS